MLGILAPQALAEVLQILQHFSLWHSQLLINLRRSKKEEIYDKTKKENTSVQVSEYVRILLSGRKPIAHQEMTYDSDELLKVSRNLGNISGNLNQIARHLNQGGTLTDEMRGEVFGCIAQISHMRDQVKEMVRSILRDNDHVLGTKTEKV